MLYVINLNSNMVLLILAVDLGHGVDFDRFKFQYGSTNIFDEGASMGVGVNINSPKKGKKIPHL